MAGAVAQDDDSGGSDAGVGDGGESPFGLNAAGRRLSGEHVTAEAKQQLLQQLRTEDEKTYDGSPETHKRPQHTPEDYGICTTSSALKAARFAARAAQKMSQNSEVMDRKKEEQVPRFAMHEIRLGKRLGRGGFSNVYEVTAIDSHDHNGSDPPVTYLGAEMEAASTSDRAQSAMTYREIESNMKYQSDARDFIRLHCIRPAGGSQGRVDGYSSVGSVASIVDAVYHGDSRYAVKFLRREVMHEPRRYRIGAADLVVEAKFLSCLEHPNIVKMRGITADGVRAFATGMEGAYFVLMDRLYDTLECRIHDVWKKEAKKYKGFIKGPLNDRKGDKRKDLLIRRLTVAFDIAGALRYLHDRDIIFRDLKPEVSCRMQGFSVLFYLIYSLAKNTFFPYNRILDSTYGMISASLILDLRRSYSNPNGSAEFKVVRTK